MPSISPALLYEVVAASLNNPRCVAVHPESNCVYIVEESDDSGGIIILQPSYHHAHNPMAREKIQSVKVMKKNANGEPLPDIHDTSINIRPQMLCLSPDGKNLYFTDHYSANSPAVYRMDLESRRCEQLMMTSKVVNGLCVDPVNGMLFVADSGENTLKRFAFQSSSKLVHAVEAALPDMPFELIDLICELTHVKGVDLTLPGKCPFGVAHANQSELIAFIEMIDSTVVVWDHAANRMIQKWKFDIRYKQNYPALKNLEWTPMAISLAFDETDQSIFISDSMNSVILRAYIASGEIIIAHSFTVGGDRMHSKPRPMGILHCSQTKALFVCDRVNESVIKLNTTKMQQSKRKASRVMDSNGMKSAEWKNEIHNEGQLSQKTSNAENAPVETGRSVVVAVHVKKTGFFEKLNRLFACSSR